MNPELKTKLSELETLAEAEIERLQNLIDIEEEKDETNDELIGKLTDQKDTLEEIINQINLYEQNRNTI